MQRRQAGSIQRSSKRSVWFAAAFLTLLVASPAPARMLNQLQVISDDETSGVADVVVSPDGAHVYAAAPEGGAVSAFQRDPATGNLTFLEAEIGPTGAEGLRGASFLAISPDGAYVYALGATDAALVVLQRDPGTGALALVQTHPTR